MSVPVTQGRSFESRPFIGCLYRSSYLFDLFNKNCTEDWQRSLGIRHALSVPELRTRLSIPDSKGATMDLLDTASDDAAVFKWALTNRSCKVTDVPHWVIMILLEDIVHCECRLTEQLVMALDESQPITLDNACLERSVERFMTNVLLASLYEDGYIEFTPALLEDPQFFDFQHQLDVHITVTPSGEVAQVWEELDLFEPVCQGLHH
jgi:hypothetical protein